MVVAAALAEGAVVVQLGRSALAEIIAQGEVFGGVDAAVEEIAGAEAHLGAQGCAVVQAGAVGIADAVAVPDREIAHAAATPTASAHAHAAHTGWHAAHTAETTTARTAEPNQVLAREVLLVDVVAHPEEGDAVDAFEPIDHGAGLVTAFRCVTAIAAVHFAENAVVAACARGDIDGFLAVAVVEAGEERLIAHAVENLHPANNFGGEGTQGGIHVVAKEFLPVYRYALYVFTLGLHLAVFGGDAGHLAYQRFSIGIAVHAVIRCVVFRGIAFLHCALTRADPHTVQAGGIGIEPDSTQVQAAFGNLYRAVPFFHFHSGIGSVDGVGARTAEHQTEKSAGPGLAAVNRITACKRCYFDAHRLGRNRSVCADKAAAKGCLGLYGGE